MLVATVWVCGLGSELVTTRGPAPVTIFVATDAKFILPALVGFKTAVCEVEEEALRLQEVNDKQSIHQKAERFNKWTVVPTSVRHLQSTRMMAWVVVG